MARMGYVLNQYPAISHTFILREIRALRQLGIEVDTFSIHRSDQAHLLAEDDRVEYLRTYALRPVGALSLLGDHVAAFRDRPRGYLQALVNAVSRGRRGPRELVWQFFYFVEAVPIWLRIKGAGLRHIHAHFTNPAADIAMVIADLGNGEGSSTWSFSAHGADIQETDQELLADKIRSAEHVVCVSDYGRSQLMAIVESAHWPKISVVHCGVDTEAFRFGHAGWRDGRSLRILNIGRLVSVKGQGVLLEAVALVAQRGLKVELTIVGDGPLRTQLRMQARRLGIEDRVDFTGNVGQDDIAAYYANADLFCLPSLREGVPVVLMEAMASGVPVIASGIMGIPELVRDGVTGQLVPPGRPDALADKIIHLAQDPDLCDRLAAAGRAWIEDEYEVSSCARQLTAVLMDGVVTPLAGSRAGRAPEESSLESR